MVKKLLLLLTLLVSPGTGLFAAPDAVTNLSVSAGYRRVTLSWSAPYDTPSAATPAFYEVRISTYRVQITTGDWASNSTSVSYPYRVKWSTSTSAGLTETIAVTGLTNGRTYFFAVRSSTFNSADYADWSAMDTASPEPQDQPQNTAPSGTGGYLPSNISLVAVATPTFSWNPASAGTPDSAQGDSIASYTIYVNTAADFSGTGASSVFKTGITTNSYIPVTPFVENTTYYWKVIAYDLEGAQVQLFSPYQRFTVNAANSPPSGVSLGAPNSGETITALPITFTWSASSDPDPGDTISYIIHVSSLPDFAVTITSAAGSSITIDVDGSFVENATYYWYVVAHDSNTLGFQPCGVQSASTKTFCMDMTAFQDPYPFTLLSPGPGAVVYSSAPDLFWQNTTDPDPGDFISYFEVHWSSYSAELSMGTDFETQNVSTTSFVPPSALAENTTYWWLVIAHSYSGGMVWTDTRTFIVDGYNIYPSSPSIVLPAGGAVVSTPRPVFDWTDSYDSDPFCSLTYIVYYSSNDFLTVVSSAGLVPSSFTPSVNLTENSMVSWRVEAVDNRAGTTTSATSYFRVNVSTEPPGTFALVSPPAGSAQNFLKVFFDWADAIAPDPLDSVSGYEIRYSTDANFNIYTSSSGLGVSSYTSLAPLMNNSTYYWRVRAAGVSGSTWSAVTGYFYTPASFDLVSPANGSVRNFLKTGFDWSDLPDGDPADNFFATYEIRYSTNSLFNVYASSAGLRVSSYAVPSAILNNATYYWRVRASAASGDTWSDSIWNFYASTGFALVTPSAGSFHNYLKVSFDWTDIYDPDPADNLFVVYDVWYSTDILFRIYNSSAGLTVSSFTAPGALINSTTYYWKVRAAAPGSGYTWSDTVNNFYTGTGFNLLSPADRAVASNLKPLFDWADVADPDPYDSINVTYEFQVSRYPDFSLMASSASGLTVSSYVPPAGLQNYTTYYWRVRSTASGISSYSTQPYFTLYTLNYYPAAFSLISPADAVVLTTANVTFLWLGAYDTESEPVTYTFYCSSDPAFSSYYSSSNIMVPALSMDISIFAENNRYYWYVTARDPWLNRTQSASSSTFYVNLAKEPPSSFSLITPAFNYSVISGIFDWQDASDPDPGDIVRYDIWYSTGYAFTTYYTSTGLTSSNYTMSESLIGQSTYYWLVKAYGSGDPAGVYTWSLTYVFFTSPAKPKAPEALQLLLDSGGGQCQLSWQSVTYNEDNTLCINLQGYRIYRARTYDELRNSPALIASVSQSYTAYTDTDLGGFDFYYLVRAVNQFTIESADSNLVYVNPSASAGYRVFFSQDGELNVNIPDGLYSQLNSNGNASVSITRLTAEETADYYKVYEIKVFKNGVEQSSFSEPVELDFSYKNLATLDPAATDISFYNGIEWIKISPEADTSKKLLKIRTSHFTKFRMEKSAARAGFTLLNWPPRAKIVTPNNDGINDEFRVYYSNPQNKVASGKVFNLKGFTVADLKDKSAEKYLYWDAKDSAGNIVSPGIYIYQITATGSNTGNDTINGTLVIAR